MSYIIAIDVGVKNLGVCIFDFRCAKIVEWANIDLVTQGRYLPQHNVTYVRNFIHRFKPYFDDLFALVIEKQMRMNMRIIESVFEALFFEHCVRVSPRSVKVHYDISTKNYAGNKRKAVEWAMQFVANNPKTFKSCGGCLIDKFQTAKKQDDYADALLLLMYYLDTYSNQLTTAVPDFVDVLLQG
jgi:hypothetical protein